MPQPEHDPTDHSVIAGVIRNSLFSLPASAKVVVTVEDENGDVHGTEIIDVETVRHGKKSWLLIRVKELPARVLSTAKAA